MNRNWTRIGCLATSLTMLLSSQVGAAQLWGTEQGTGTIYRIDTAAVTADLVDTTTDVITVPTDSSPNGNALDAASQRFYFATFELVSSLEALPSNLYFNDLSSGNNQSAGLLDQAASAGVFHAGSFFYIAHASDDLFEVVVDANGMKTSEIKRADISADSKVWGFGDIAFARNGTLFGSATVRGPEPGGAVIGRELFSYQPDTGSYQTIAEATCESVDGRLVCTGPWWGQIAFADDGQLWGHDSNTGDFFTINLTTGERNPPRFNLGIKLTDLAAALADKITFAIDIKPGSSQNKLNITGRGKIPVAILGSALFDVADVDPYSLTFGGMPVNVKRNGKVHCAFNDVSGDPALGNAAPDGYVDLMCHFLNKDTLWAMNEDGTASVVGNLYDGTPIEGRDSVEVKKPRIKKPRKKMQKPHPHE